MLLLLLLLMMTTTTMTMTNTHPSERKSSNARRITSKFKCLRTIFSPRTVLLRRVSVPSTCPMNMHPLNSTSDAYARRRRPTLILSMQRRIYSHTRTPTTSPPPPLSPTRNSRAKSFRDSSSTRMNFQIVDAQRVFHVV